MNLKITPEGSFQWITFSKRYQQVLDQIVEANISHEDEMPNDALQKLRQLRKEIGDLHTAKVPLSALQSRHPDWYLWAKYAQKVSGVRWIDLDWYEAEAYFHRYIVLSCGFMSQHGDGGTLVAPDDTAQSSNANSDSSFVPDYDCYYPLKRSSINAAGVRAKAHAYSARRERADASSKGGRIAFLQQELRECTWGNMEDLNFKPDTQKNEKNDGAHMDPVVCDDTLATAACIESLLPLSGGRGAARIHFVCDNSGNEFLGDLLLAKAIESLVDASRAAPEITFHVKKVPTFVSDTTLRDVAYMKSLCAEVDESFWNPAWKFVDDFFWSGPDGHFGALPAELSRQLGEADLAIVKGDANYRRLVADICFPGNPHKSFVKATGYFPSKALVALRTLKSEALVGLSEEKATVLSAIDPKFLVSGKWAVVQFRGINTD